MSKPRYGWWPYAKSMVRRYPDLVEDHDGSRNDRREYEAVRAALFETEQLPHGRERINLIDLVFWKRSHTIEGAAHTIFVSPVTARRWHGEFIHCVGEHFGFLD